MSINHVDPLASWTTDYLNQVVHSQLLHALSSMEHAIGLSWQCVNAALIDKYKLIWSKFPGPDQLSTILCLIRGVSHGL